MNYPNNEEIYKKATQNGLVFRYFHGESKCPDEWEGTKKGVLWGLECVVADDNSDDNAKGTCQSFWLLNRDEQHDKNCTSDQDKRIPRFISENTTASRGEKAVAYDAYSLNRYYSPIGRIDDKHEDDYENLPFNWNRGFDDYFQS